MQQVLVGLDGLFIGELRRLRSITVGAEVGKDASNDREIQDIVAELNLQTKAADEA